MRVAFSVPLAQDSPLPSLAPAIPGTWRRTGTAAVTFTPDTAFPPLTSVRVVIPGGQTGVRSAAGRLLPVPVVTRFRTGRWRRLRFEQLLAQLGYLPLSWAPAGRTGSPAPADAAAQLGAAYHPPAGMFTWQAGYPAPLRRLWAAGENGLILRGAVMAFQSDHGLAMNGSISQAAWRAMLRAAAAGQNNAHGYTYARASKASPETLTIWHDGSVVFRHGANTGIPVAPTADGTYPVYLRYRFQVMQGANPTAATMPIPSRSSPTSTAATRCTTSRAPPTAPRKAWAASSFPAPPPSAHGATSPTAALSPSPGDEPTAAVAPAPRNSPDGAGACAAR